MAGRIEDTRVEDPSDFQTPSIGFRVQLYDEKYDDRDGILNSDVPKQIRFVIISNNFHFKFNIQWREWINELTIKCKNIYAHLSSSANKIIYY